MNSSSRVDSEYLKNKQTICKGPTQPSYVSIRLNTTASRQIEQEDFPVYTKRLNLSRGKNSAAFERGGFFDHQLINHHKMGLPRTVGAVNHMGLDVRGLG